jgi:hypothetical protein
MSYCQVVYQQVATQWKKISSSRAAIDSYSPQIAVLTPTFGNEENVTACRSIP